MRACMRSRVPPDFLVSTLRRPRFGAAGNRDRASQLPGQPARMIGSRLMDLGIGGRRALLSGASRGLGKACALALAREGVDVTIVARRRDVLEAAADEIRKAGATVTPVAGDIATPE